MSKERRRICFFMCYIHNEVENMSFRRCPFYKFVPDNRSICTIAAEGNMKMVCGHYLDEELNKNNMRLDLEEKDWVMIF